MKAFLRRRGPTIAVAAVMFVAGGATVTTAQNLITSADIQNGTIRTVDLADNAVTSRKIANGHVRRPDIRNTAVNAPKILNGAVRRPKIANTAVNAAKIANGAVRRAKIANNAVNVAKIANGAVTRAKIANNAVNSAKIANGSIQIGDISAAARDALTAFSGVHWSVVDRGVIGNGDSDLASRAERRAGCSAVGNRKSRCPHGCAERQGGVRQSSRVLRRSRVRAHGDRLLRVHDRGEQRIAPNNMPSIAFEINPNLGTSPGVTFATTVYLPENGTPSAWTELDAVADDTTPGASPGLPGTTCDFNGPRCTLPSPGATSRRRGAHATIFTAQIGKGRDFAFSGAVDALRINNIVYDFEPTGVFETHAVNRPIPRICVTAFRCTLGENGDTNA